MNENKNILDYYKSINNSKWIDWLFKILYSIAFIFLALAIQNDNGYPDSCFGLVLIAIWLYFLNIKTLAIFPLLFSLLINYSHNISQ